MSRNVVFFLIAASGMFCFVLTGISIGERSVSGALASLIASVLIIGFGFVLKKRWLKDDN